MKRLIASVVLRIIGPALDLRDEQEEAQAAEQDLQRLDLASPALSKSLNRDDERLQAPGCRQVIEDAYRAYWLARTAGHKDWEAKARGVPEADAMLISSVGRAAFGQSNIDDIELPSGEVGECFRARIQLATKALCRARSFDCADSPIAHILEAPRVDLHADRPEIGVSNAIEVRV